ncbi:MAG: Helix-turn-helix domain [Pseudomonadota bacterium]|jgi:transcriptional regulator with XRE-family HTH domain
MGAYRQPMPEMVPIGRRLRQLRKARGWTLKVAGEQIGCSLQAVHRMEKGIIGLSMQTMLRLSEIYEVSCDHILKGTDPCS